MGLIKLSAFVDDAAVDADAAKLLAGQIVLGYVSATELFLRQTVARMTQVCPFLRSANADQMIPFGAVDYYGRGAIEQALTERTSFSEPGTIKKQLEGRFEIRSVPNTSLARSTTDFERLCQLRHALVHSHGIINSSNALRLLQETADGAKEISLDATCLQWAASVAVNLVRDVTQEVLRSTIWRWLTKGYLVGDARSDRAKVRRLMKALRSEVDDQPASGLATEVEVRALIRSVLADLEASNV